MPKPVPTAARPAASAMAMAMAVLVVSSLATQPALADDNPPDARQFPYGQTGKGCAVGAVLGSVVPGLGTAVGCVFGGVLAWWRA